MVDIGKRIWNNQVLKLSSKKNNHIRAIKGVSDYVLISLRVFMGIWNVCNLIANIERNEQIIFLYMTHWGVTFTGLWSILIVIAHIIEPSYKYQDEE